MVLTTFFFQLFDTQVKTPSACYYIVINVSLWTIGPELSVRATRRRSSAFRNVGPLEIKVKTNKQNQKEPWTRLILISLQPLWSHQVFWGENVLRLFLCAGLKAADWIRAQLNLGTVMSWFRPVKWLLARRRAGWTVIRQIKTEINPNSCSNRDGGWQPALRTGNEALQVADDTLGTSPAGWRCRRPPEPAQHQEFPNATMNFSHFLLSVSQRVRSS